jgi:hypothetical protein
MPLRVEREGSTESVERKKRGWRWAHERRELLIKAKLSEEIYHFFLLASTFPLPFEFEKSQFFIQGRPAPIGNLVEYGASPSIDEAEGHAPGPNWKAERDINGSRARGK